MPKWQKGATEFVVSLNRASGTHGCKVPKPVVELLGSPGALRFVIRPNGRVEVEAGEKA